ncbi:MAG: glycosyltransferase family 2 protein [Lachnospiraceae bacterium]|nr:glycosyltransferase family 2 protein [Lachnospiraceae bacterium]
MTSIDVIVPCYNEEAVLGHFFEVCDGVLKGLAGYTYRFLFINDGSSDGTLAIMRKLAAAHPQVKYLSFSRNFGKESAMYAGFCYADADLVIVMDADLQHPPHMIPDMLRGIEEGYDCCAAMRSSREGESRIHSFFSRAFYRLNNRMSKIKLPQGAVDFRVMKKTMVDAILQLSEVERFSKGIFSWVGFDTKWYPYENIERAMGSSKWSFSGLFSYALDGITSFSTAPLRLVSGMGLVISLVAFIYILVTLIQTLLFGIDVPGYVTTLCAVLFLGGVIELSIGVLGEYLGHMYKESKHRPLFIVKDTNLADPRKREAES